MKFLSYYIFSFFIYTSYSIAIRPVEDTAPFRFVVMMGRIENNPNDGYTKFQLDVAKALPDSTKLVLVVPNYINKVEITKDIQSQFASVIPKNRVLVAFQTNASSDDLWARDIQPIPIYNNENSVSLIDFKNESIDLAHKTKSNILNLQSIEVGGNLIASSRGDCFTVQGPRSGNGTDEDFKKIYGCKELFRLPYFKGIGHVDEVIKPISENVIITNTSEYVPVLNNAGYEVILFPQISGTRSYINSLIIGNRVLMPTFGVPEDNQAISIYKKLGYTVYPIDTHYLAQFGGNIHCATLGLPN